VSGIAVGGRLGRVGDAVFKLFQAGRANRAAMGINPGSNTRAETTLRAVESEVDAKGECYVWLEERWVNRLRFLLGPGESY
jgi:hypothetical protein